MPWLKFALGSLILGAVFCASASAQSSNLATESDPDTQPSRSFQIQVRTLFDQESFSQLDDIAEAARSQKQRLLGGGWKLRVFYNALRGPGSLTSTDDAWNAHFAGSSGGPPRMLVRARPALRLREPICASPGKPGATGRPIR